LPRIIINADDFGLTRGVNRAIAEAHKNGVVTSTTLMAKGAAFDDAVGALPGLPHLSVGCHVVLVDGSPVLPPSQASNLIEERSGQFRDQLSRVVLRAVRGQLDAGQVEAEVAAQIRKLQAAGIAVSHVDTHKHTHIFPQILRPILRAAQACGVKAIRNPFGRLSIMLAAGNPALWKRYVQVSLLNRFAARFRRAVADAGMITTDGSLGVVATGALDEELFRGMMEHLPEGTWEFVCHPGYNDVELQGIRTRLRASREEELAVLTSTSTRKYLENRGIELVSYTGLTAQLGR
jgi:hopanoid biosynthesis associated protein HpnK